jgi:multidrug efflux pump subunit AcrB
MPNPNYGQMIIVTKNLAARDRVRSRLKHLAEKEFIGTSVQVDLLPLGPPAGRPVQYRVTGPDVQKVRQLSQQLATRIGESPLLMDLGYEWNEPGRVVKVDVQQDKAHQLGVTSEDIARSLHNVVGGTTITQIRDDI